MLSRRALVPTLRSGMTLARNLTSNLNYSTNAEQKLTFNKGAGVPNPLPWHLTSAVCLERPVLLTPALTSMEQKLKKTLNVSFERKTKKIRAKFDHFFQEMEVEQSLLSDHEMQHRQDLARAEMKKAGTDADFAMDAANLRTARDIEDAFIKEASEFEPASRESEADKANDATSIHRARDRPLRLIVDYKVFLENFDSSRIFVQRNFL